MVAEHHPAPGKVGTIQCASGVGKKNFSDSNRMHETDVFHDILRAPALIKMDSALRDEKRLAGKACHNESPCVPRDSRYW
jgi:hypothetical protein